MCVVSSESWCSVKPLHRRHLASYRGADCWQCLHVRTSPVHIALASLPPYHLATVPTVQHAPFSSFFLSLSLFSLPLLGLHHQSPREFPVISPLFSSHWCAAIDDAGSLVVHLIQRASNCPQLITCLIDASSPIVPFVIPLLPIIFLSTFLTHTHWFAPTVSVVMVVVVVVLELFDALVSRC